MPVYEILSFPASEVLIQDHGATQPLVDYASRADGVLEIRSGFAEEDKKSFYSIIKWESLENHKSLRARPEHAEFHKIMKPLVAGVPQVVHVEFDIDPTAVLDAPVTEVTWFVLKVGITKADIEDTLDQEVIQKTSTLPGVVPGTAWNQTIEDPSKCLLLGGWRESKDHIEGTKHEMFKEPFAKLAAWAGYSIEHVSFRTVFKKE
ncbi:hypothetical protein CPB83DRAFT_860730 [Crepidotus variabilis]|uniref:ABM domain-containing protein n=1 Tax=Crepidotus variabilis TaxID=179855 RepID=A0A9P6JLF5_9AGAR|nr:hypothetical protein CPB83DRAFT_860730 [Crepidotus variabilis]